MCGGRFKRAAESIKPDQGVETVVQCDEFEDLVRRFCVIELEQRPKERPPRACLICTACLLLIRGARHCLGGHNSLSLGIMGKVAQPDRKKHIFAKFAPRLIRQPALWSVMERLHIRKNAEFTAFLIKNTDLERRTPPNYMCKCLLTYGACSMRRLACAFRSKSRTEAIL